jgi:vancomycin permeability regulator SanA
VADRRTYLRATWYQVREIFALTRAWLDLKLFKPVPVLGDPIPVEWDTREGGRPQ